jgi:hypothetical protein
LVSGIVIEAIVPVTVGFPDQAAYQRRPGGLDRVPPMFEPQISNYSDATILPWQTIVDDGTTNFFYFLACIGFLLLPFLAE